MSLYVKKKTNPKTKTLNTPHLLEIINESNKIKRYKTSTQKSAAFLYTNNEQFKIKLALAGVAQWIECQPMNQRVPGSIPSQGTCLGCGPGPQWGGYVRGNHTLMFLSLSSSLALSLKINKI